VNVDLVVAAVVAVADRMVVEVDYIVDLDDTVLHGLMILVRIVVEVLGLDYRRLLKISISSILERRERERDIPFPES